MLFKCSAFTIYIQGVFPDDQQAAAAKPPPTCGGRDGGGSSPATSRTYAVFIFDRGRKDPQLSEDQRGRVLQSFSSALIACHFVTGCTGFDAALQMFLYRSGEGMSSG